MYAIQMYFVPTMDELEAQTVLGDFFNKQEQIEDSETLGCSGILDLTEEQAMSMLQEFCVIAEKYGAKVTNDVQNY